MSPEHIQSNDTEISKTTKNFWDGKIYEVYIFWDIWLVLSSNVKVKKKMLGHYRSF